MAPRPVSRRAQRGLALLGLLAVIIMVFAWILTSRLNAANQYVALDRVHNAKVLSRAKAALIGYMAQQAAMAGENNPGSLPCPEAPANFGVPAQEGITAGSCTLPAVGRLPWRTIGVERLVDAAGEPLWYVVSPGWAMPNSTTPTVINSDSLGQLTLDGAAGSAVALIIAPGPAIAAQAGSGCASWTQTRPTSGAPDLRNYLECENASSPADASFVTTRPGQAFNDQVLRVTAADVLPALEAAVAERTQREIAPALRTMYPLDFSFSPRRWVSSSTNPPMFPYAAPFGNPGTTNYQGASGMYRGLLPVAPASAMVVYASTPGPAAENNSGGYIMTDPGLEQACTWVVANDIRQCQGFYHEDDTEPWRNLQIRMTATFANVAMGLRAIDTTRMKVFAREDGTSTWTHDLPVTYQAEMNDGSVSGRPRGSVTIRFWATLPNIDANGWDTYAEFRIRIERAVIGDHALLDTATSNPLGWFVRNQWHRVHYYRVAEKNTADGLPSIGCSTDPSASSSNRCLRFNDENAYNIRALLVQAGRSLTNPAGRPNATLSDYLEVQNCDFNPSLFPVPDCDPQYRYENRPMRRLTAAANPNAPWNDRVILLDWAAALTATQRNPTTLRLVALP